MTDALIHIATAHSPFREKFAIPRQPGLATAVRTRIELLPPYNRPEALQGLEGVSHIWLLFLFHQVGSCPETLRVRPPRLGGNERIGVFASRSTHRPNGIGQSVVRVEGIEGSTVWVSGADLLDGTPIIDIKPFVPYSDMPAGAHNAVAPQSPPLCQVEWHNTARAEAQRQAQRLGEDVVAVIEQCLAQDPRPAYQAHNPERNYGVTFWDLNITWCYPDHQRILVTAVVALSD